MGDYADAMSITHQVIDMTTREENQDRVTKFLNSFDPARELAQEHGMSLVRISGGFQLRRTNPTWIYNLYPKVNSDNPRVYPDPKCQCPFLQLPRQWDLLDAVKSLLFQLGTVV